MGKQGLVLSSGEQSKRILSSLQQNLQHFYTVGGERDGSQMPQHMCTEVSFSIHHLIPRTELRWPGLVASALIWLAIPLVPELSSFNADFPVGMKLKGTPEARPFLLTTVTCTSYNVTISTYMLWYTGYK